MIGKLAWIALLALWLSTFAWIGDVERRQRLNGAMDELRWDSTHEVLATHAKAINQQTRLHIQTGKWAETVEARI